MKEFLIRVWNAFVEARMDAARVRLQQHQGFWY